MSKYHALRHWLTRRRSHALAIALCIAHIWLAASVSRNFSTTYDEIAHVTGGYTYWTANDLRFQPENGNLPQRWCALPLLWMDLNEVPPDHFAWSEGDVWTLGDAFFYARGNNPDDILAAARTMVALLSGLLCWVIYLWSRGIFGNGGGLISLSLAALSPTLLANGGLATSDTTATLAFCIALISWWRLCHRISAIRILAVGVSVGLLATAKYSALLFAPIAIILLLVRMARSTPLITAWRNRRWRLNGLRKFAAIGASGIVAALLAWVTLWGFYEFRFNPSPDPNTREYLIDWDQLFLESSPSIGYLADGTQAEQDSVNYEAGIIQTIGRVALDWRLLPEAYVHGLLVVDRYSRSRLAFFAGEYSNTGWWTYFPATFLTKTTFSTIGLMGLGIVLIVRSKRYHRHWYRLAPLLVLLGIYGATILTSNLSIGHRHTLPLYPLVFIVAGATAELSRRRWGSGILAAALLAHGASSAAIRPHYLAYFNQLGGGPENAHRLFVDSTLDWGQDLPGLADWIKANVDDQPLYLSYFGSSDPRHYGIEATRIGDSYFDHHTRNIPAAITGGTFAISATMLRRVYTPVRGPWSPSFEATYTRLQNWVHSLTSVPTGSPILDFDGSGMSSAQVTEWLRNYESLQFGRLCYLLEHRKPNTHIGYSILIYRLSDDEVNTVLYGSIHELNTLIADSLDR